MKGRFKVNINKNLDMPTRIQSFSNDPVAYYLHKNRNFIRKLQPTRNEVSASEKCKELCEGMDEFFYNQRRDQYYANLGIDPRNASMVALMPPFEDKPVPKKKWKNRTLQYSGSDSADDISLIN